MSAVNHQFRLAVRWRKHFHRPRGVSLDGPGKLAKSNADQVARATADRWESRHRLTMINGCCAQIPVVRRRLDELVEPTQKWCSCLRDNRPLMTP
jgi:hypothetical protein